eukprot:NODE_716_length_4503_cov_0.446639.p4 type:complete len:121 gc:universal NODE_716_length_4503_cov_0.446639:2243-1881(-)
MSFLYFFIANLRAFSIILLAMSLLPNNLFVVTSVKDEHLIPYLLRVLPKLLLAAILSILTRSFPILLHASKRICGSRFKLSNMSISWAIQCFVLLANLNHAYIDILLDHPVIYPHSIDFF